MPPNTALNGSPYSRTMAVHTRDELRNLLTTVITGVTGGTRPALNRTH